MTIPNPIAAAAGVIGEVAAAAKDSRPPKYCLKYIEGTPMAKNAKHWRFGYRRTWESCEATRLMCMHPDQIEIVEVGE